MKTMDNIATKENRISIESAKKPLLVCFVCSGNTCRSPMAAAVLNHLARAPKLETMNDLEAMLNTKSIRATSAGLSAWGDPIASNAAQALEEAGIPSLPDNPYREHCSRTINDEIAQNADLLVGLTENHVFSLLMLYPQYASKITGMPKSISDPFGGDLEVYKECLAEITASVKALFFGEETP